MKTAHLITDMTNGFTPLCPQELPVAETLDPNLDVVGAINRTSLAVRKAGWKNIFSRDWHNPGNLGLASTYPDRAPFTVNAASWPDHSMANTFGAAFVECMDVRPEDAILYKGFAQDHPFSALAGNTMKPKKDGWIKIGGALYVPDQTAYQVLDENDTDTVFGTGVAWEYCVDGWLVDTVQTGRTVYAVTDGIAFFDPTKKKEFYEKWQDLGIVLVTSDQVDQILAEK